MSASTEVVRRLFAAFNARDLESVWSLLDPEIVFEPVSGAVLNDGEPYLGEQGMRRYIDDVRQHWQELTVSPVHMRAAGDAVVALGQVNGRSSAGSLEDVPTSWVFKFKDGRVAQIQVFSDERLARLALGL
ncbi:MAG: nuclear transport factor 2 family protein [Solirubrobacteraceae bacterium]